MSIYTEIPVSLTEENILSGGVSIKGVITRVIERGKCEDPILQQFQFVPYFDKEVKIEKIHIHFSKNCHLQTHISGVIVEKSSSNDDNNCAREHHDLYIESTRIRDSR